MNGPRTPEPEHGNGHGDNTADLLDRIAQAYALQFPAASGVQDFSGQVFGNYRLTERIGRGGMGEVYRAERADGAFEAKVAVKLLRASIDSELLAHRFHRERQLLARLDHPNISRLLDGGSGPHGIPFLVMEWIDGEPLTDYAARLTLNLERRLALFAQVCEAVAYAHRNLVVHRDLKPSNILVTGEGRVKLLDFGIGKLLSAGDEQDLTLTDTAPMTRAYAAPEQILGEPITTATDVYALGVVLYELVTERRPHQRDTHAPAALAARVDSEIVTRPSEKVFRAKNDLAARRLARHLRGDLDTIAITALKREPERRYPSAEALLEDLRRRADGLPIRARPDTVAYRAGKFLRRHRFGVAATAILMLALAAGLGAALWQAEKAREEARRAENAHQLLLSLFREQDPLSRALLERQTPAEFLAEAARRARQQLESDPPQQARIFTDLGELLMNAGDLDQAENLLDEALDIRRSHLGHGHQDTARTLIALARLHRLRGRYPDSGAFADAAAGILAARLGTGHPDTWQAQAAQVMPWMQGGRAEDAVALARSLVEHSRTHYGDSHPETAQQWYRLAELHEHLDRLDPAREAAQHAITGFHASLGAQHPRLFPVLILQGDLLRRLRDYEGAIIAYREGIALVVLHLGPDHPILSGAYARLADTQRRLGDLEGAENALLEAERLAVLADRKDQLAQTWVFRARIAAAREDWPAAVAAQRQGERYAHQTYGEHSSYGVYASIALARVLADAGETDEAMERLAPLLETLQAATDTPNMQHVLAAYTQGRIAWSRDQLDETVQHFQQLLDLQHTINGEHSPAARYAGLTLAEARLARSTPQDVEHAAGLLQAARELLESGADPGELSWFDQLWLEAALARILGTPELEQAKLKALLQLPEPTFARDRRRRDAAEAALKSRLQSGADSG